jgi:hypothetical protein
MVRVLQFETVDVHHAFLRAIHAIAIGIMWQRVVMNVDDAEMAMSMQSESSKSKM